MRYFKRLPLRFSLRTFLIVTLALSLLLGWRGRIWYKAWQDRQPPTLKELASIAKRHGIAMPPRDAKLVMAFASPHSAEWLYYSPAFLLQENELGIVVLRGAIQESITYENMRRYVGRESSPLWREFSLDANRNASKHVNTFCYRSAVLSAVQLADQGNEEAAQNLLVRVGREQNWGDYLYDVEIAPELVDLRDIIAWRVYDQLEAEIRQGHERWPAVLQKLDKLLADFPGLGQHVTILRRDLAAAIDNPAALAGSVEQLLVEWSHYCKTHSGDDIPWENSDSPVQQIVLRGFDAVPALIDLRDDDRATTHPHQYLGTPCVIRLGELADRLLREIAGHAIPDETGAASWRVWWETTRQRSEVEFLDQALFSWNEGLITHVKRSPAFILAHKYPAELPQLCRMFCQQAKADTEAMPLVEAICLSRLAKDAKLELLAIFIEQSGGHHQTPALEGMLYLDRERGMESLLQVLSKLPVDASVPVFKIGESSPIPEVTVAEVVRKLDDLRAWQAYRDAARRCNVALRIELLGELQYSYGDAPRGLALYVIASFLNDETVRDLADIPMDDRHVCANRFDKLTVRDFAAMTLADMLELKLKPAPSWTAEQWSELREQIRKQLANRELPAFE